MNFKKNLQTRCNFYFKFQDGSCGTVDFIWGAEAEMTRDKLEGGKIAPVPKVLLNSSFSEPQKFSVIFHLDLKLLSNVKTQNMCGLLKKLEV